MTPDRGDRLRGDMRAIYWLIPALVIEAFIMGVGVGWLWFGAA